MLDISRHLTRTTIVAGALVGSVAVAAGAAAQEDPPRSELFMAAAGQPSTTAPPTTIPTSQPSGALPQTGPTLPVGIAAMGGLLSVAGAVLLAGVRRRKSL